MHLQGRPSERIANHLKSLLEVRYGSELEVKPTIGWTEYGYDVFISNTSQIRSGIGPWLPTILVGDFVYIFVNCESHKNHNKFNLADPKFFDDFYEFLDEYTQKMRNACKSDMVVK